MFGIIVQLRSQIMATNNFIEANMVNKPLAQNFQKKLEETECIDTWLFANNNHLSRDLKKKFFDFL